VTGGVPCDQAQQEEWPVGDGDYQQANGVQAFKLGRLVLLGPGEGSVGVRDMQNLVKFLLTFEEQCGIYLGRPDGMDSRRLTQPMPDKDECAPPSPTPVKLH
jgi:hypothetical protein